MFTSGINMDFSEIFINIPSKYESHYLTTKFIAVYSVPIILFPNKKALRFSSHSKIQVHNAHNPDIGINFGGIIR